MARAGGYFVLPFKRYHGTTQVDPLPPKLFNMVVNSIIHHWVTVVAEIEEGPEGLGMSIWDLAAYFYSYNGLIASNQTERLQRVFAILIGLFDQVDPRQIHGRQQAWLARHATRLAGCWWRHMRGGRQGQVQRFGRDIGGGYTAQSSDLRSRRGCG